MTITNGYCTLVEIKNPSRLNITDTDHDTDLEGVIEAVSREIDLHCGRQFWTDTSDVTRYITPRETDKLLIGDWASITTLSVDDGSGTYTTWTEDTDFNLWPYDADSDGKPFMMIETANKGRYAFVPGVRKGAKLIGKRGWPAVPKPIKEACILWTMRTYKRYATPLGISAMSALGQQTVKVPPPDTDVMLLLSSYTILQFG